MSVNIRPRQIDPSHSTMEKGQGKSEDEKRKAELDGRRE
jgi:hypothetical protein